MGWRRRSANSGEVAAGPDASASTRAARRVRWRRIGTTLLLLSVLGTGADLGWWLRGRFDVDLPPVRTTVTRPVTAVAGPIAADAMPSMVGLTEAAARQVLFDAGVGPERLRVEETPAAGEAGVIVAQEPAPGERLTATTNAVLRRSIPASVPEVVGIQEAVAREALAQLGARVKIVRQFDPGAAEGTVLAADPAPGSPLVDEATLTVASAPSAVFADALQPVDSDCSEGSATVNGSSLSNSLLCSIGSSTTTVDYALNRELVAFEATLGQNDRGETGHTVRVIVLADDREVASTTVGFGTATPLRADIRGALRVRIEMMRLGTQDRCCPSVSLVLGSARFVGSPDAVAAVSAKKS